jgi:hypothetical protein
MTTSCECPSGKNEADACWPRSVHRVPGGTGRDEEPLGRLSPNGVMLRRGMDFDRAARIFK